MLNKGKCSNVRAAITEKVCEEFRERNAMICRDCPGPQGGAQPEAQGSIDASSPAQPSVDDLAVQPSMAGFFVDFTGHEDLLAKFKAAANDRGLDVPGSALDLIYLFVEGLLCLKGEL